MRTYMVTRGIILERLDERSEVSAHLVHLLHFSRDHSPLYVPNNTHAVAAKNGDILLKIQHTDSHARILS